MTCETLSRIPCVGDLPGSRLLVDWSSSLVHKWPWVPLFYAFCLIQFLSIRAEQSHHTNSNLLLVFTLSRHGDRSPVHELPDDPYRDHWSDGLEQLTPLGVHQHRDLGEFVRRYYGPFIPEKYHKDAFFFRSSGTDRTLQSATSFLAGLFHPRKAATNEADLFGPMPVPPVHSMPTRDDRLLKMSSACPAAKHLISTLFSGPLAMNAVSKYQRTIRVLLTRYPQMFPTAPDPSRTLLGSWKICDPLIIWASHDLPGRPSWLTDDILRDCEKLLDLKQFLRFSTASATRLHGGPLVAHLLRIFRARANAQLVATGRETVGTQLPAPHGTEMLVNVSSQHRLVSYFAHDSTLAAVMSHLGVFDGHKPPLASTLIAELYEVHTRTDGEENINRDSSLTHDPFQVRFLYRNFAWPMVDQPLVVLWPPACGQRPTTGLAGMSSQSNSLCSISKLEAAIRDTYALSETDECFLQSHWFSLLLLRVLSPEQHFVQFFALLISQAILLGFLYRLTPDGTHVMDTD